MSTWKKSKYIKFRLVSTKPKTGVYDVTTRDDGSLLGKVKWYATWSQYSFFPAPNTLFTKGCMSDISDFITKLMEDRNK